MKKSLESKDIEQMDLLKQDDVNQVLMEVNSKFEKLNGLSNEKIEAFLSNDKERIINHLIEIGMVMGETSQDLEMVYNIHLTSFEYFELLVHLKTTKKEDHFESCKLGMKMEISSYRLF